MAAFIASFILVFLAEMGDKTQLLAMAFAAKYKVYKVLIAISLATLLINLLSVIAGHLLTTVMPLGIITFLAALSFIIFGLWTIRPDETCNEGKRVSRFGPIITVGLAFFIAEIGDKTQLATVSLAVEYRNMLGVLAGTTLAMVSADAIGITFGVLMRKYIPEKAIKRFSACIFILFGFIGVYKVLSLRLNTVYLWGVILSIGFCTAIAAYYLSRPKRNYLK